MKKFDSFDNDFLIFILFVNEVVGIEIIKNLS